MALRFRPILPPCLPASCLDEGLGVDTTTISLKLAHEEEPHAAFAGIQARQSDLFDGLRLQHEYFLEQLHVQLTAWMEREQFSPPCAIGGQVSKAATNVPPDASQNGHVFAKPVPEDATNLKSASQTSTNSGRTSVINHGQNDSMIAKDVESMRREKSKENNLLKRFVTSTRFDYLSTALIISNAAFIGVQVEFAYAEEAPAYLKIIDCVFCVGFLFELVLRLYARGLYGFFIIHDRFWNRFDFFIVFVSTFDTLTSVAFDGQISALGSVSLLRITRIVRIIRVLRIIRVIKFFKDMRVLVSAIASTLKTAFWALLLLVIAMYMFGIAIGQMVAEEMSTRNAEGDPIHHNDLLLHYFGSIGTSIFTLFMTVAGGISWEVACEPLSRIPIAFVIYMFFIAFSSFCMMNVVTGIFCQSAVETYENDRDMVIECQLQEKARFVRTLTEMFTEWDSSCDGVCSREDFERHISDQKMQSLLSTLDIETRDAMALYAMMDHDGNGVLNLEDFITGCIALRGDAKAIHMERSLVDGKVTLAKLDRIIKRLDEAAEKGQPDSITYAGRGKKMEELGSDVKGTFSRM